jgi:hypothetical protein
LALFYLGVAHLGAEHGNVAIPIFESLLHTSGIPKEASRWYLALALVQAGEIEKALKLLEQEDGLGKFTKQGADLKKAILEKIKK